MNIAVIGGASSYTPELVDGLLRPEAGVSVASIRLMDPDTDRLAIIGGFVERMIAHHGSAVRLETFRQLDDAIDGADAVITQIRVGGMRARISDERLGRSFGILGQETTGIGGFASALRTIPRILDIADAMGRRCPNALLINFTNPAGIITEAVLRHSATRTVGLCNIPIGMEMDVAQRVGCSVGDVELDYVGLNHLAWVTRVRIAGEDRSEEILATLIDDAEEEWAPGPIADAMREAMRATGAYANPYLQYFYARDATLARQARETTTRGEDVLEIEKTLFRQYADPAVSTKPAALGQRGGAHYSTAAVRLLAAVQRDEVSRQIVCCRNGGAAPGFDGDAAVDLPARIDATGALPLPVSVPPPAIRGLMQSVKAYETLTVEAAVTGDRAAALRAMSAHPLLMDISLCDRVLTKLLEVNRPFLSETFFSGPSRTKAAYGG